MIAATLAAAFIAGCATAPDTTLPDAQLPAQYDGATAATAGPSIGRQWWRPFDDTQLDALVDAALERNADVRLAVARVDETEAVLGLARAAQWPGLDLGGSVVRSRASALNGQPVPATGPESTTHRLALTTSFEIDLWGRLRNATAAAQAQLLAAQYARDAVQLVVAGSVVQTYLGLRTIDAQLAVLQAQAEARAQSLAIVERRLEAGVASTLERAQARVAQAVVAAQRPELQRQRALLAHQLAALAGEPGRRVAADPRALPAPIVAPPGLPSELLRRRPDVQQAEAALRAAQAQVEVARAAMWPTLSLTGSFGGQSADLVDLLKGGARIWSIGPSLLMPLFDGGRQAARTEQARSQATQAAIGYQQVAQQAFREVADALSDAEHGAVREAQLERQRSAAGEALRVAERRFDAGYSGYLEVLDAQRSVQDADLTVLQARQARLDASVRLLKALGGGWATPPR